mmetsp:Transcript_76896/g.220859  ORF Transcript_76896/g.220859 Transcript_76896/m.220859 type:complete len:244 (-) Transcript_76896:187-918(-)
MEARVEVNIIAFLSNCLEQLVEARIAESLGTFWGSMRGNIVEVHVTEHGQCVEKAWLQRLGQGGFVIALVPITEPVALLRCVAANTVVLSVISLRVGHLSKARRSAAVRLSCEVQRVKPGRIAHQRLPGVTKLHPQLELLLKRHIGGNNLGAALHLGHTRQQCTDSLERAEEAVHCGRNGLCLLSREVDLGLDSRHAEYADLFAVCGGMLHIVNQSLYAVIRSHLFDRWRLWFRFELDLQAAI